MIFESMERFAKLPEKERTKIRFIHLNHTNPVLDRDSDEAREVVKRGFRIAEELERVEL